MGNVTYSEKVNGAPPVSFPTEDEIYVMDQEWRNQALQGSDVGLISLSGNQNLTYSALLYINGNITLTGNSKLTITGSGVVYVNGNVQLTGNQTWTNGAILVVKGTIQQTGNSI